MTSDRDASEPTVGTGIVRWLAVIVIALMAPLLLGVIVLFVWGSWHWIERRSAQARIQEQWATINRAVEPASTEQLRDAYRVTADGSKATQAWVAAWASFEEAEFDADGQSLPFVGNGDDAKLRPSSPDNQLTAAQDFLDKYAAVRTAALKAAQEPGECRFAFESDEQPDPLPYLVRLYYIVRYLALDMRVRALQGDGEGATQSLEAIYAAAASLKSQPSVVEQRTRSSITGYALFQTTWLLGEVELADEQLVGLQARLEVVHPQEILAAVLIADLEEHASHGRNSEKVYRDAMAELIQASQEPFPEGCDRAKRLQAQAAATTQSLNPVNLSEHMVTRTAVDVHLVAFKNCGRQLADRNLLLAAIAAERHRQRTGEFPASIDQIEPSLPPIDPFTGAELILIAGDGEVTLYSVGPDGIDNGGDEGQLPDQPDIVVRLKARNSEPQ